MIPFPERRYDIIYADPPWQHDGEMGMPVAKRDRHKKIRAEDHYRTMSTDDLCALPVSDISKEDCLIFMWISSSMFCEAIEVGQTWGFKYKTIAFVWYKQDICPWFLYFGAM